MTEPDRTEPRLAAAACSAAPPDGGPGRGRGRRPVPAASALDRQLGWPPGGGRRARQRAAGARPGELDEYYVFFIERPDRRGPYHRPAVDARADAHPGVQPLQRHRLGHDQRKPQDPDRGAAARDQEVPGEPRRRSIHNGDPHHPHLSFTDGTYDGRYLFINDKANSRVARIRCDVMKSDKIIEMPNAATSTACGCRSIPRTGYVFCNGEHGVPIPNDGKILDDPQEVWSIFTAVDGDTMKVAWQVMVDGNLDNCRRRLSGQVRLLDLLQLRRRASTLAEMTGQRAGLGGDLQHQADRGGGQDGRLQGDQRRAGGRRPPRLAATPATCRSPNSPHGINTAPDGIHVVVTGKLSPTVTVIDVRQFDDLFDDKIKPRDMRRRGAGTRPRPAAHRL